MTGRKRTQNPAVSELLHQQLLIHPFCIDKEVRIGDRSGTVYDQLRDVWDARADLTDENFVLFYLLRMDVTERGSLQGLHSERIRSGEPPSQIIGETPYGVEQHASYPCSPVIRVDHQLQNPCKCIAIDIITQIERLTDNYTVAFRQGYSVVVLHEESAIVARRHPDSRSALAIGGVTRIETVMIRIERRTLLQLLFGQIDSIFGRVFDDCKSPN